MINMAASQAEFQDQVDYIAISSCAGTRDRYYLPCWVENEHLVPMGSSSDDPQTRMWYKKQFTNARAAVPEMNVNEKTISDDYCTYGKDLIAYEPGTQMTKENEIRLKDA